MSSLLKYYKTMSVEINNLHNTQIHFFQFFIKLTQTKR